MKGRRVLAVTVVVLALLLGTSPVAGWQGGSQQGPQVSFDHAFTYQGQLENAGGTINGTCDLLFSLWDSPSAGAQIGTDVQILDKELEDGLFAARLDFGGSAFSGAVRWLEVAVRCPAGSGEYVTLSPRQELTSAPAALSLALPFAAEAGIGGPLVSVWNSGDGEAALFGSQQGNALWADAGLDGLHVAAAGQDGVRVITAGNQGFAVDAAGNDGVYVGSAGSPSATYPTAARNGLEVAGAEGDGVYVGRADGHGVSVSSAGGYGVSVYWAQGCGLGVSAAGASGLCLGETYLHGVHVGTTAADGLHVDSAGIDGLAVQSAGDDGVSVLAAGDDGFAVNEAGGDGVYVGTAGTPTLYNPSPLANGFEVAGVEGHGLYVGQADGDGVFVDSAGHDGVVVHSAGNPSMAVYSDENNGFEVAGAEGHGLYIGRADRDGVHVGTAQYGMRIGTASRNGVGVDMAGWSGVYVGQAGDIGIYVGSVGIPSTSSRSEVPNGFQVDGAQGAGLSVGRADLDGAYVSSAGYRGFAIGEAGTSGVYVGAAGEYGVYVGRADLDGVYVNSTAWHGVSVAGAGVDGLYVSGAGDDGVDVRGNNYAGNFRGNINVTGDCYGCTLAMFGLNAGDQSLEPGQIVAIQGIQDTTLDNAPALWRVVPAGEGMAAVGVVRGSAELDKAPEGVTLRESESGQRLVPREGAAQPGEYLSIVIHGPMQVSIDTAGGSIQPGTRLAVGGSGAARALQTVVVQGVTLAESAPTFGIALSAPDKDGLAWVLVNPQ